MALDILSLSHFHDLFNSHHWLVDETGTIVAADEFRRGLSNYDDLALNLQIPSDGTYTLHIVGLDWSWYPSYMDIEISLD